MGLRLIKREIALLTFIFVSKHRENIKIPPRKLIAAQKIWCTTSGSLLSPKVFWYFCSVWRANTKV